MVDYHFEEFVYWGNHIGLPYTYNIWQWWCAGLGSGGGGSGSGGNGIGGYASGGGDGYHILYGTFLVGTLLGFPLLRQG